MSTRSHWSTIMTPEQLTEYFNTWPEFGRCNRADVRAAWFGKSLAQLDRARAEAWFCNDGERFMLARTMIAINTAAMGA